MEMKRSFSRLFTSYIVTIRSDDILIIMQYHKIIDYRYMFERCNTGVFEHRYHFLS